MLHSSRIVTVTLNPALDLASEAEKVRPVHKIRTTGDHIDPGGGGINVARVVHALGGATLAVVVTGGVTGRYVEELLEGMHVPLHAVRIHGHTRISLTVHDQSSGLEYRFVPKGPLLSESEWQEVLGVLEEVEGGWLVASGSLPLGVPPDAYAEIARLARRRGMKFVLDSSGSALAAALGQGLELIKPSLGELEHLAGRPLRDAAQQDEEALALVRSGAARMIAVTLGAQGALLATEDRVIRMSTPPEKVRSAVGAGDAFLASMTIALDRGATQAEALAWGVAAGAAAIGQLGTARVAKEDVEHRYNRLIEQSAAARSASAVIGAG